MAATTYNIRVLITEEDLQPLLDLIAEAEQEGVLKNGFSVQVNVENDLPERLYLGGE